MNPSFDPSVIDCAVLLSSCRSAASFLRQAAPHLGKFGWHFQIWSQDEFRANTAVHDHELCWLTAGQCSDVWAINFGAGHNAGSSPSSKIAAEAEVSRSARRRSNARRL